MSDSGLTDKQRVFLEHYLMTWNATEAARQAGYAYPNVEGPKNLVKPSIAAAIRERLAEKTMSADEVLARLTEHARGSLAHFMRLDAGTRPGLDFNQESARQNLHLIKRYSIGKGGAVTIELYDAQAALTTLAKHYSLLVDRQEHSGPNGGPIPIEAIDYHSAIAPITAGSEQDSPAFGDDPGTSDGT